jgi:hypothetical protein
VPRTLHEIQRKYLENVNFDALAVACFSAMDRPGWSPELHTAAQAYDTVIRTKDGTAEQREAAAVQVARAANRAQLTPFTVYCMTDLIPALAKVRNEHLALILQRAVHERDLAAQHNTAAKTIDDFKAYAAKMKEVLDALKIEPNNAKPGQ